MHALRRRGRPPLLPFSQRSIYPYVYTSKAPCLFVKPVSTSRQRHYRAEPLHKTVNYLSRTFSGVAYDPHEVSDAADGEDSNIVTTETKEYRIELLVKYVDENVEEIITRYEGKVDSLVAQSNLGPSRLEYKDEFTLRERWEQDLQERRYFEEKHSDHVLIKADDNVKDEFQSPFSQIMASTEDRRPTDQHSSESSDFDDLKITFGDDLGRTASGENQLTFQTTDTWNSLGITQSSQNSNTDRKPDQYCSGSVSFGLTSFSNDVDAPLKSDEPNPFPCDGDNSQKWRDEILHPCGKDHCWKDKAMSLLSVMRNETWSLYDDHNYDVTEHEHGIDGRQEADDFALDGADVMETEDVQLFTVESLLNDAEEGKITMSTEEYNVILLTVATSSSKFHHKMVDILMNAYMQMKEFAESGEAASRPNADTYAILLMVLDSRGHCREGALEICSHIAGAPEVWARGLVAKVMRCFEHNNEPILGKHFLDLVIDKMKVSPSRSAFLSLIRSFKRANMIQEALELFDVCAASLGIMDTRGVDHVVREMLSWRDGALPNRTVVLAVADRISSFNENSYYRPSWMVWRQITLSLGILAEHSPEADWEVVRKAVRAVLREVKCSPRLDILSVGLAASEALRDSQLAVDLLQRIIVGDTQFATGKLYESETALGFANELEQRRFEPGVPLEAFRKAIDICIASGDIENCFVLLDQLSCTIPAAGQSEYYTALIKGCVVNKCPERGLEVIAQMRENGVVTREEDYGTVMAGLIKAGKREEALQIIQSMTAGEFGDGVVPGLNVYNAMVMSHVVSSEWHDALSVYDTIRQLNITPDKTTLQGLLIACNRIGDRARALDLLTEFLQGNMTMNKNCFEHCLKILIPKEVRASSIGDVRARLRAYGTRHSAFKQSATNLSRSLRLAEIEDDRQESERISELDLQGRRAKAWRDVIKKTIEFSQLVQNGQNKAVNGTNG